RVWSSDVCSSDLCSLKKIRINSSSHTWQVIFHSCRTVWRLMNSSTSFMRILNSHQKNAVVNGKNLSKNIYRTETMMVLNHSKAVRSGIIRAMYSVHHS